MNNELTKSLSDITNKIITNKISCSEIKQLIEDELEAKDIWEVDDLLITDCYYALKHIKEDEISPREWLYFQECFDGKRRYNSQEKIDFISTE